MSVSQKESGAVAASSPSASAATAEGRRAEGPAVAGQWSRDRQSQAPVRPQSRLMLPGAGAAKPAGRDSQPGGAARGRGGPDPGRTPASGACTRAPRPATLPGRRTSARTPAGCGAREVPDQLAATGFGEAAQLGQVVLGEHVPGSRQQPSHNWSPLRGPHSPRLCRPYPSQGSPPAQAVAGPAAACRRWLTPKLRPVRQVPPPRPKSVAAAGLSGQPGTVPSSSFCPRGSRSQPHPARSPERACRQNGAADAKHQSDGGKGVIRPGR